MATLSKLIVSLMLDAEAYNKGFEAAQKTAEGFGAKMKDVGGKITAVGGVMTATTTAPILAAFDSMIDKASDMSETVSKVKVVFGEAGQGIVDWARDSAQNLGMTREAALGAIGTYGNLFRSMEMSPEVAGKMSQSLVQLASDLGSFNNMNPTDVLDKLRAGLTGETEPLKALGVNLSAAAIQAKALEMGLAPLDVDMTKVKGAQLKLTDAQMAYTKAIEKHGKDSHEAAKAQYALEQAEAALAKAMEGSKTELSAAAKAQATYALIMEQTKLAQGDFARTSDGLANKQRIAAAASANLTTELGEHLLPIKLRLMEVTGALGRSFGSMTTEQQKVLLVVLALIAGIGPLVTAIGGIVTAIGVVAPAVSAVAAVMTGPLALAIGLVVGLVVLAYTAWTENWGGIQQTVGTAVGYIQQIVQPFVDAFGALMSQAGDDTASLGSAWETVKALIGIGIAFISTNILSGLQTVAQFIQTHAGEIKGLFSGAWNFIQGVFKAAYGFITGDTTLFISGLRQTFNGAKEYVINMIALMMNTSADKVREKIGQIKSDFIGRITDIKDWLVSQPAAFGELGAALINGMINSIMLKFANLKELFLNELKKLFNAGKAWLDGTGGDGGGDSSGTSGKSSVFNAKGAAFAFAGQAGALDPRQLNIYVTTGPISSEIDVEVMVEKIAQRFQQRMAGRG